METVDSSPVEAVPQLLWLGSVGWAGATIRTAAITWRCLQHEDIPELLQLCSAGLAERSQAVQLHRPDVVTTLDQASRPDLKTSDARSLATKRHQMPQPQVKLSYGTLESPTPLQCNVVHKRLVILGFAYSSFLVLLCRERLYGIVGCRLLGFFLLYIKCEHFNYKCVLCVHCVPVRLTSAGISWQCLANIHGIHTRDIREVCCVCHGLLRSVYIMNTVKRFYNEHLYNEMTCIMKELFCPGSTVM